MLVIGTKQLIYYTIGRNRNIKKEKKSFARVWDTIGNICCGDFPLPINTLLVHIYVITPYVL